MMKKYIFDYVFHNFQPHTHENAFAGQNTQQFSNNVQKTHVVSKVQNNILPEEPSFNLVKYIANNVQINTNIISTLIFS